MCWWYSISEPWGWLNGGSVYNYLLNYIHVFNTFSICIFMSFESSKKAHIKTLTAGDRIFANLLAGFKTFYNELLMGTPIRIQT